MVIDEIYSAAVQGNLPALESLLSRRQVNLNQLYETTDGGMRIRFPLLYSVLLSMSRGAGDARAVELLVRYGADVNGAVIMESGGAAARAPFLACALAEWNAPHIAQCLLACGADPCALREVNFPGGGHSATPMLCLALQQRDPALTDMLLRAGADPNQHAEVYVANGGYTQQLPPLYTALVTMQDAQKCRMLLAAGASVYFPIVLGPRPEDSIPFLRYIQGAYPQLAPALESALAAVSGVGAQPPQQAPAMQPQSDPLSPGYAPVGIRTDDPYAACDDGYGSGYDGGYGGGYDDGYGQDSYDDGYNQDGYDDGYNQDGYDDGYGQDEYGEDEYDEDEYDEEDEAPAKPAKKPAKKAAGKDAGFDLSAVTDVLASLPDRAKELIGRLSDGKQAKKKAPVRVEPWDGRPLYGKFAAYCFANFGLLTIALCVIAPIIYINDLTMALGFFCMGLLCAIIPTFIWLRVRAKAQRYGLTGVFPGLIIDSLLMVVRVTLCMLIFTIPLVKFVGGGSSWEERTTTYGRSVAVRSAGDGEYEDAYGNRYKER